jgi:hypothetical protein
VVVVVVVPPWWWCDSGSEGHTVVRVCVALPRKHSRTANDVHIRCVCALALSDFAPVGFCSPSTVTTVRLHITRVSAETEWQKRVHYAIRALRVVSYDSLV